MRTIIATFNSDENEKIQKCIKNIPEDVSYVFKLHKIKIGHVWESYHWSIYSSSKDSIMTVSTDYSFSATNILDEDKHIKYDKFNNLDDAKKFILDQIPEACWKYVTMTKHKLKD